MMQLSKNLVSNINNSIVRQFLFIITQKNSELIVITKFDSLIAYFGTTL